MQYDYYLNSIRARKRPYQKWHKKEETEKLELIKEHYNYSDGKAREVMTLLDDAYIDELRKQQGGMENVRSKRTSRGNP